MRERDQSVLELLAEGLSQAAIARRLGVSNATISRDLRLLGFPPFASGKRYDWPAVQRFYDEGHSVRECVTKFGMSSETWHSARTRGDLVTRTRTAMPLDELLSGPRNRRHLKERLVALGLKHLVCEECGVSAWRDKPLSLCLHHINGVRDDNHLENLQLLCPNCHSQTENFSGRNRGRRVA